jgi:hypothetical protein
MANLIPNDFSSYQLTEQEELEGSILTITQKQVIQNYLAAAANEKIGLEYSEEAHDRFIQQEASLKGQIDAYRFILAASDSAEELLTAPPLT